MELIVGRSLQAICTQMNIITFSAVSWSSIQLRTINGDVGYNQWDRQLEVHGPQLGDIIAFHGI